MRIKLILLFVFLFSLSLYCEVIMYNQLPEEIKPYVVPDMQGRVWMDENFEPVTTTTNTTRELPTVHDGFPVAYSQANCYKGAIYCNMDDDPEMEIIFGVGKKVTALNLDGTTVPGWPVNNTYYIWSSPACGDIDGDGVNEIVATSRNNTTGNEGELYAYELDGTACTGFPVTMAGGGTMNACLSDLDNDDDMEIFVNVRNSPQGWVYVYQGDGTVVEGWPATLDYVPGASISVADLDNDGTKEVIALSYNSLYVFDNQGNTLPGFPFTETGTTISYSQPTLYDMDNDGDLEILYGACTDNGGKVFAFHHDGTNVTGWPKVTTNWVFGTVALGDIDNNGALDVVVGDQVSSTEAADWIYAWDLAGNDLAGFPAGPTFAIYTQVAIADLDNDNNVEIMIDDNRYGIGYECYNHDGSHCADWPLACGTAWSSLTMMITPVVGDFDNDGFLNIAGAATDIITWNVEAYVWDTTSPWNEELAYTKIDGFNIQHDGLYPVAYTFVPEPPQNCLATLENYNDILVTWDPPVTETPESYNVYLDDEIIANIGAQDFSYSHSSQPEGTYDFSVSALYPEDQVSEIIACDQVEIIFPTPENLSCEILPTEQVNLSWDFTGFRELAHFAIYRDGNEIGQSATNSYSDNDVTNENDYEYYVIAVFTGEYQSSPSNTVYVYVTNSDDDSVPNLTTQLKGNYPNPFNPETTLLFSLGKQGNVSFKIYDVKGNLKEEISAGIFNPGYHNFVWNASEQASGIYFVKMFVNGNSHDQCKVILMK